MTFFEQLILWDKQWLLSINSYHQPWLDRFMWLVSDPTIWAPVLLVYLVVLFRNKGVRAWLIIIAIAVLFLLTDQLSSHLIKPLVARLRPTHDPLIGEWINVVNNYRGGKYGFVSGHAANSFAFAGFTLLLFRNPPYTCLIVLWAILVSFSRIYLGVHYPLDVLAGGLLGFLMAVIIYQIYNHFFGEPIKTGARHSHLDRERTSSRFLKTDIYQIIYFSLLLIITLILTSISLNW